MPDALGYFTHVTKAYEILGDEHKRAIYDEESITDEEFFTIKIGPLKINMFSVFILSCIGCAGYFAYYQMVIKPRNAQKCPIDHKAYNKL